MKAITHQQQGPLECVPTVVSMLSGIPKEKIMHEAVVAAGFPDFFAENWPLALHLADLGRVQIIHDVISEHVPWLTGIHLRVSRQHPIQSLPEVLEGRGAMSIVSPDFTLAHIVAYQDGVVFDPGMERAVPYSLWKEAHTDPQAMLYQIWADPESL